MVNKLFVRGDRSAIAYEIGDGSSVITAGYQGVVVAPFDAWIDSNEMQADQDGDLVVDIWKCSYADYNPGTHPVDADSITASAPLTIASGDKSKDETLAGWTRQLTKGDILAFNVDSIATITRALITLNLRKR
jgi:hypothetical protein